ncbi:hypothetical protein DMA15_03705 [Streptomyces sp. WAC 01529]|uniref:hypothetical protein n=1 Tax=Streptomyces sp. WAC 01529 TaxID=2203205 RepID=UPI000F71E267|nr:hypothetical protein [Streptomyces sp. WAC 01529]AZM51799.1 hypothetical protein DMA15_03705 [Streptomyces sp. WAC 01529]
MSDRTMPCPVAACTHEAWVAPGDEDTSFSELWDHVVRRHQVSGEGASHLMALVAVQERSGNVPTCPNCHRVYPCICP